MRTRRISFQQVPNAVAEDVLKNGLALEPVSLRALDQTLFHALDDNDAFNAVGMSQLAEIMAESKTKRAAIEADNALSDTIVGMKVALARLEAAPEIAVQWVNWAEKFDSRCASTT